VDASVIAKARSRISVETPDLDFRPSFELAEY
jgi:hypothetical protein